MNYITIADAPAFDRMTKREYFAANFQFNPENMSYKENVTIMGCEAPTDKLENIKWWISAQAKYRVMFADLLINALNEAK